MSSTRILRTLLLTLPLALAATAAPAQSIAPVGENQARPDSQTAGHDRHGRPWDIVGAWFATTSTGLRQLWTFHADGTAFRSVPGEVSTAPGRSPHTLTHGVWRFLGDGRFGVTAWDIFYDINTAQLIQYTKVRLEITLGEDRDEATARAKLEFLDPQGGLIRSVTGSASFVRIPFDPLD